ncbi:hypothetical protein N7522_006695 [Penicillium canescens]|nr:hypothetical protein N7522_006695 [Penicillium canescens]
MSSSDHSASTREKALAALARLTKQDTPRHPSKRTPIKKLATISLIASRKLYKKLTCAPGASLFIDARIKMMPTGPNF